MSDEPKPAESAADALQSLSSFDIGPAWARGGTEKKKGGSAEGRGKRRHDDRGDESRGEGRRERRRDDRREGRRDDRREGRRDDRREGRRDDRREGRRDDRREGRRDDRREGRGGKGRRFDKRDGGRRGGHGRREDDRGGRREREEVPPPEGFTAEVMPVEDGLDGLAKEILAGGRTYSVFDLAKLVLGARERFNVSFRSNKDGGLFRCKKDGSLWLTKEEALRHFWRADWRKDFYEEVVSSSSPPQGNFQTVARCALSGEWLGPPNYHGYQPAVLQLHRERFGNMPLEAYKKKIRMERGEEAVAAWLDKMSKRVAYRPASGASSEVEAAESESTREDGDDAGEADQAAPETEDAVAADELASAEAAGDSVAEPVEDVASADEDGEPDTVEESEDADGEAEGPMGDAPETAPQTVAEDEALLDDMKAVERHFVENHFDDAFQSTGRAWVGGNIPGSHLSPELLTLLRHTVAEERRYPGKLTPMLCRQLSGRHVAVFKWRRKLKAGPSRPHPVPGDIAIADRPTSLLNWITEHSGKKLEHLWKALLPEKVSDEEKTGWYHDLHWLLNQGYVLLMADSTVHLAKSSAEGDQPKSGKAKARKAAGTTKKVDQRPAAPTPPEEEPRQRAPKEEKAVARSEGSSEAPGLYSLNSRMLNGSPKSLSGITGRGLWPLLSRLVEEEEEEEGQGEPEVPIW